MNFRQNGLVNKRWIYKPVPPTAIIDTLSKSINVNPYLASLLVQRGIGDFEGAKCFFRPSLDNLHDPFLIKDMDKAVDRLKAAVDHQEKILIYGDYDVDGTTAVALVYRYFKRFCSGCDLYTPDRITEGYGISKESIIWASEDGFSLIVALDMGIKSANMISFARQKGIDVIICDHHLPGDKLPEAVAVLNPKRKDCSYPFKELSGCGLGFKLVLAFAKQYGDSLDSDYNIDLVGVSIAADIVPVTGENRILAYYGLKKLNENPVHGLAALKKVAGIDGKIDMSHIVFGLAPRINAAGRVAHAKAAIQLLVSETDNEATPLAVQLDAKNKRRKELDRKTTSEALAIIKEKFSDQRLRSTVLYKADWHKGVIGIVAARCVEAHYKPTIVLTKSNDEIVGSGRSVVGFDLYRAVSTCHDLLEKFGGHKYAVGLTLNEDKLKAFQHRFEKVVSSTLTEEMMTPTIAIDMELPLNAINDKFASILKQMAPFGPENQKPVFVARQVFSAEPPIVLKEKHIRFFVQQQNSELKISAIGFDMRAHYDEIAQGKHFNMAFTMEENKFGGNNTVQLRVKDIKFDSGDAES